MAEVVVPGPWPEKLPDYPVPKPSRHYRLPTNLVPWRKEDYKMTLCGKYKGTIRFVEKIDDATCAECSKKFPSLLIVMANPLFRIKEAIRRERDGRQLTAEFMALSDLAERHREEFDNLVESYQPVETTEEV